jgi:hypothetical protein
MVCNTQEYWVFVRYPLSDILKNTTIRKLDPFPSSGKEVEDTCSVGSVRNSYPQPLDQ